MNNSSYGFSGTGVNGIANYESLSGGGRRKARRGKRKTVRRSTRRSARRSARKTARRSNRKRVFRGGSAWTEHTDPATGKIYYYDKNTRMTTYHMPAGFQQKMSNYGADSAPTQVSESAPTHGYNQHSIPKSSSYVGASRARAAIAKSKKSEMLRKREERLEEMRERRTERQEAEKRAAEEAEKRAAEEAEKRAAEEAQREEILRKREKRLQAGRRRRRRRARRRSSDLQTVPEEEEEGSETIVGSPDSA